MRSRAQLRFKLTAAAPKPVRTRSQSRSEPSWPPQNAEIVYGVGSARLVVRATYANEKSFRSRGAPVSASANDFSFVYARGHEPRAAALYTISAFWGGQEGSLLLWLLVLTGLRAARSSSIARGAE